MKEHLAPIGLGLLPIYWYFWKNARNPEYDSARKWLTVTLAAIVLVHVPGRPHRQQRAGVRIMSTTTQHELAARPRPARWPPRRRSGPSRSVFAIATPVIYVVCEMRNWPLFTYHPGTNRVDLSGRRRCKDEGPAMYWYGWTATTLIGAGVLGLLATMLPESIDRERSRCR